MTTSSTEEAWAPPPEIPPAPKPPIETAEDRDRARKIQGQTELLRTIRREGWYPGSAGSLYGTRGGFGRFKR